MSGGAFVTRDFVELGVANGKEGGVVLHPDESFVE